MQSPITSCGSRGAEKEVEMEKKEAPNPPVKCHRKSCTGNNHCLEDGSREREKEKQKETMMRRMRTAVEAGEGGGCLLRVLLFSDSILSANMDLVHGWS